MNADPASVNAGECYVSWYEAMEKTIEAFFEATGVTVNSGHDETTGRHRHHEAILEELGKASNPFYDVFIQGAVRRFLRAAKKFRNLHKADKTLLPNPMGMAFRLGEVHRALWMSFGIVDSHMKRGAAETTAHAERRLVFDKKAADFTQWETCQRNQLKGMFVKLGVQQKALQERVHEHDERIEKYRVGQSAAWELGVKGKAAQAQLQWGSWEKERGALQTLVAGLQEAQIKHVQDGQAQMERVKASISARIQSQEEAKEMRSLREAETQAHKIEVEHLENDMANAIRSQREADKEIEYLKQALSKSEDLASTKVDPKYHSDISDAIIHHQSSRLMQQRSTRTTQDDDLAKLVQNLLSSHIKAEIERNIARANQATLQQQVEGFRIQLAMSESRRIAIEEFLMSL